MDIWNLLIADEELWRQVRLSEQPTQIRMRAYDRLRSRPFNPELEPLTYFEMQLLRDSIFRRQAAPSPSGQILTRALIGLQEAALPRVLRPIPRGPPMVTKP